MTDRQHAQQRITACWNMASASYDATPGHGIMSSAERDAWLAMLRDVLPPPPCDVLDVGTGTGFLAFHARQLGHRVRGIDLSVQMLAIRGVRRRTSQMRRRSRSETRPRRRFRPRRSMPSSIAICCGR
ncbi:MAG: methyltransferase domain-containing protein [Dehalococcoidia bacterium]